LKCIRCNKREAEVIVAGKRLCRQCGRNEIINRLRKNIKNIYNDYILLIYFEFNTNISDILGSIIKYDKIDKYKISIKYDKIDKYIWKLIIESRNVIKKLPSAKIITAFPADFLLAYTIYSTITGEFRYIEFINYEIPIDEKAKIYQPLYNITSLELKVISDNTQITDTGDSLFDKIYSWILDNLKSHEEIYRSFRNSLPLLTSLSNKKCKLCKASINSTEAEYCEYCTTLVTSSSQS